MRGTTPIRPNFGQARVYSMSLSLPEDLAVSYSVERGSAHLVVGGVLSALTTSPAALRRIAEAATKAAEALEPTQGGAA